MTARFAPTEITADLSKLSATDRQVLAKLVQASRILDALFLRQVWAGNESMLLDLVRDQTPEGRARLHYFLVNKGPWSRLDHNEPFVPGAPAKPEAGNFYPASATKAEIERWTGTLPAAERERATGFFTVVRRAINGTFSVVPYSVEYQNELAQAATLLREAAAIATEPTLKAFLTKRADAFLSNDYYDSDVAWMELKGAIEPTIGPYECMRTSGSTRKPRSNRSSRPRRSRERQAAEVRRRAQDIEDHLPIDPKYRNPKLGGLAPLVVVNEILAAGDANHGVQTAAFNLPNDERVVAEKGRSASC
jgi:hypothetical protein